MMYQEISEISSSFSVALSKNEYRMDPHYYFPEFVNTYSKISKMSTHEVRDFFIIFTGKSPPKKYSFKGAPFVRIQNLTPFGIELDDVAYVDRTYISNDDMIKLNDILITITGATIGKVSINQFNDDIAVCSDIAVLTPRNDINKNLIYYIYGILQTTDMFKLFMKGIFGVSNGHLSAKYIERLPLPLLSEDKAIAIGKKLKESIKNKLKAKKKKKEIDEIFAKYLPMDFDVPNSISFLYKRKDCPKNRRSDPKFFSPKLDTYIKRLRNFGYELQTLDKLKLKNSIIHRGIQPEYSFSGDIPVVKTRDVNDSPIDWSSLSTVDEDFYLKNQRAMVPKDTILITSTGEGSWGRTSISNKDKAIADGHITIVEIDSDIIDPYYVCSFLWTSYGKAQYHRRVRGCTGQTEIYPFDIKTIEIPRLSEKIEKKVGKNLREYVQFSEEAKSLHQKAISELEQLLSINGGES